MNEQKGQRENRERVVKDILLKELGNSFLESGVVKKNLLQETAEKIAKQLVLEGDTGVSRHQFRRFYDEIKKYKTKIEAKPQSWDSIVPLIKMLRAKVAYAVARIRDGRVLPYYQALKAFFDESFKVAEKDSREFLAFCLFLEAVYAYYYSFGGARTQ